MPPQGRVLLIGGRTAVPSGCREDLLASGYSVTTAETGRLGLEKARRESFDVAVLDLEIPDLPGLQVLAQLKQESPSTAVLALAAQAGSRTTGSPSAEEAMRAGAFDCIEAPGAPGALIALIGEAARHSRRALEDACIAQELERMMLAQVLIGRSEAMRRIGKFLQKAASVDAPVLVSGEPGTGKEVIARAIHRLSRRSNRRFVSVDCRKSEDRLLEIELFGTPREAVPGAAGAAAGKLRQAEGGTLFLDEISDLGAALQQRLLQVILGQGVPPGRDASGRQADVRIVSATCRDLSRQVDAGAFREDLFWRINALRIAVPPLRERVEDIPPLADYYIRKFSAENHRPAPGVSDEAMRSLQRREWPGNVRELVGLLNRAVAACSGDSIAPGDIAPETPASPDDPGAAEGSLARLERDEILRILEQFRGNKTRAARHLGINRKTLREKMERYGLQDA